MEPHVTIDYKPGSIRITLETESIVLDFIEAEALATALKEAATASGSQDWIYSTVVYGQEED